MSESERESAPRHFVVDTNVFVSAIKPFSRRGRKARTGTGSLALLLRLITDTELELFGNLWLFDEYKRLAEELSSETSELILGQLTGKMREVAGIGGQAVARCRPHIPERESADIMHAATCLQAKAVLITNDRDFDGIKESGVIEVWSISEAIRKLSIQRFSDAVIRITRRRPAGSLLESKGVGGRGPRQGREDTRTRQRGVEEQKKNRALVLGLTGYEVAVALLSGDEQAAKY